MAEASNTPRIITPQDAQAAPHHWCEDCQEDHGLTLLFAERDSQNARTEPDRTRAAVVKALRHVETKRHWAEIREHADAVENGADW